MFHVKQFVIIYDNVPRETMQNVPRETFFPCFLPVGGLSGADWRGGRLVWAKMGRIKLKGKGGKVGGCLQGGG